MNAKLSERVRSEIGVGPADISSAKTGTYFPVANYRRIQAVAVTAALGANKKATLQLMQAQDASGTGAKVLGAAVETTTVAGGAVRGGAPPPAAELDTNTGNTHGPGRLTSHHGSAVQGAAVLQLGDGRFSE